MIKSEIWRDTYYRYVGDSLQYAVFTDDMMIFSGKAWKNPSSEYGKICISDICRNWLEVSVPDFLSDGAAFSRQYREFTLYSASVTPDGFPIYTPLETYGFLLNWDYEGVWDGASEGISEPINGHMDSRMKLMYSVFSDATGQTICREEELIKKIHISPSYIEAGNSGLTRTVEVTSNFAYEVTNNNPWIHITPSSGNSGTTVFTITIDENPNLEDRSGFIYFGDSVLTVRQSEAALVFEVEPTSIYAPYDGGMYRINYTSNTDYLVISNVPWATASSSAGTPGSGFFTVTVQPSTSTSERTGNIRVGNVNVSVRQEAVEQELSVSPSSLSFDFVGGSKTITITSNSDYNITTNSPWITLSASSGTSGTTTVTVFASMNSVASERNGKIYVGNQEVSVSQDAFETIVQVEPSSLTFSYEAGSSVLTVTANTTTSVVSNSNWISVSHNTIGSGVSQIVVTVAQNSDNDRSGSITIGNVTVPVSQVDVPYITLSPTIINAASGDGTYNISIYSNTAYTISSNAGWAVVSADSGSGNMTLSVTVEENLSYLNRYATITVGDKSAEIRQEVSLDPEMSNYLTMEVVSGGTIGYYNGTSRKAIEYSINDSAWTQINPSNQTIERISVSAGDIVRWRGNNTQYGTSSEEYCSKFSGSTAMYNLSGNVMSIVSRDNFSTADTVANYGFRRLFAQEPVLSASKLILPAYTVKKYSYGKMFDGCSNMSVAPQIKAIVIDGYAMAEMFRGSGILQTPTLNELEYITYGQYGVRRMFENCTKLTTITEYPSVVYYKHSDIEPEYRLGNWEYESMFKGCTSLVSIPPLPSDVVLWEACCQSMFENCTSLVNVPDMPSSTLVNACYYKMFKGCTSLVNAPALPATEIKPGGGGTTNHYGVYECMFEGCTSLTSIPALPQLSVVDSDTDDLIARCYNYMFKGCTSLTTVNQTLPKGSYREAFKGCVNLVGAPSLSGGGFREMFADCTSLTTAPYVPSAAGDCYGMFSGCTSLTTVPVMGFAAGSVSINYMFSYMFAGCTSLVSVPFDINFTDGNGTTATYEGMFSGCTSLTSIKVDDASSGSNGKFSYMFDGCSSLSSVDASTPSYTDDRRTCWLRGVSPTGTFYKKAGTNWVSGEDGIPTGWTIVEIA